MVGQLIAWMMIFSGIVMIFGGVIPFFGTGFLGGIWLIFIGWFLHHAAIASYRQIVVQDLLEGVPVSRLMRSGVPTVPAHIPVGSLVHDYLMGTEERAFPVTEGDHLEGLVSLEDVRRVPRDAWDRTEVSEIMTPADRLEAASPREDTSEALLAMARRDIRQMPVVENGHLVGMLRLGDIVRWLQMQSDGIWNR
jgi:CBS domain-containing protein